MSSGFQVVNSGFGSMLRIKKTGQGPSPKSLKGLYTSHSAAQAAIDQYLRMKRKGNGKTGSSSSD